MTPNEEIARRFADQFTPPLQVIKTQRINNLPVPDAWQISYHDAAKGIGITAVAYGGGIHAFIEAAGQAMAKALGLFQEKTDGNEEARAGS